MNYEVMLNFHKENDAAVTIAAMPVPKEEAKRFGIVITDEDKRINDFEEKPENPKSNLASMGIYIFTWSRLREALIEDSKVHPDSDFGNHIIPRMLEEGQTMYAYRFKGYWKDVGTIESYWQANMELIRTLPDFNLYEDFWKIYTNTDHQPPQYTGPEANIKTSIVSDGCEVYGQVYNSILGPNVIVKKGAVIRDSIIMGDTVIGENSQLDRCIIDEDSHVGDNVKIGVGDNIENEMKPKIYNTGITVVGHMTTIPNNVVIGKNCVLLGNTTEKDFADGVLQSGKSVIVEEVNL